MAKILMCDDEVHILRAAEFKLTASGHELEGVLDGEQAWTALQRSRPDLLISDRQMPRLDGLGLIRRIRGDRRFDGLPIILLTSRGHDLPSSEDLGVELQMAKPFSPRELAMEVDRLIATTEAPHAAH